METRTTKIVEEKLLKQRKENVYHCKNNPSEYAEKIRLHNKRFGEMWSDEEIAEQISESEVLASFFAKDSAKQNLTEQYVADIIRNNSQVSNFEILSKGGKNSIRLDGKGNIIKGNCSIKNTKSVDFSFSYKGNEILATQKFTRGKGGSQDNQCRDVVDFLKCASLRNGTERFMAILDGDYYTEEKMKELRGMFKGKRNITVTSADIFIE